MVSRQHSLVCATTLLVILTSQSSFAFTIIPPTGSGKIFRYRTTYNQGSTQLDAWPFPDPRRFLGGQVHTWEPKLVQPGEYGFQNRERKRNDRWESLQ